MHIHPADKLFMLLSKFNLQCLCVVPCRIIIIVIMILFLKRFSMLNMLNCAVQCQLSTQTYPGDQLFVCCAM